MAALGPTANVSDRSFRARGLRKSPIESLHGDARRQAKRQGNIWSLISDSRPPVFAGGAHGLEKHQCERWQHSQRGLGS